MTFFGVILIIVLALAFIGGVMEIWDLVNWRDLREKPKSEQPLNCTIHVNIFSKSGGETK